MGNQASTFNQFPVVKAGGPPQWKKEGTTGYCDIVRHTTLNTLAEEYTFQRDGRLPLVEDCQRYEWRRNQTEHIIQVYQVEREPRQYLCQGEETIRVRTERIPQRLFDRNHLTQQQAMSILSQALSGFAIVYQIHGKININDQLIGFAQDGRVKVWLNENIARNLPNRETEIFESRRRVVQAGGEATMVRQIYDVVQGHVQGGSFSADVKEAFSHINTFGDAINYVQQYGKITPIEVKSVISEVPNQNVQVVQAPNVQVPQIPQIAQIPQVQNISIRQSGVGVLSRVVQAPQPTIITLPPQTQTIHNLPVNQIPAQNFVKFPNSKTSQLTINPKPHSRGNLFFPTNNLNSQSALKINNKSSRSMFPVSTINRGSSSRSLNSRQFPLFQPRNLTVPKGTPNLTSRINRSSQVPQEITKKLQFNKSFDTQNSLNRKMFDFNSASGNLTSLASRNVVPAQSTFSKPVSFTYQKAAPAGQYVSFDNFMKNIQKPTEGTMRQLPKKQEEDVTPETLFEPRPPSSERKQIKIVYESEQLDAYTLDNLAKQSATKPEQIKQSSTNEITRKEEIQQLQKTRQFEQKKQIEQRHQVQQKQVQQNQQIKEPQQVHYPLKIQQVQQAQTQKPSQPLQPQPQSQSQPSQPKPPQQQQPQNPSPPHPQIISINKPSQQIKTQPIQQPAQITEEQQRQQQLLNNLQLQIQQLQAKKTRILQAQQYQEQQHRRHIQQQTSPMTDHSHRLVQLQHQFTTQTAQNAPLTPNQPVKLQSSPPANQNKNSPVNVLIQQQPQEQKPQQPTVRFEDKIRYEQPPVHLQQQYFSQLQQIQKRERAEEQRVRQINNNHTYIQSSPPKYVVQTPIIESISQESLNKQPAIIQKDVQIIEQNGKAMGFEVVETDVYYTAGGEKVTVEEDYEVIYKDNGQVEVVDLDQQYPPKNLRDVHHIPVEEIHQSPQRDDNEAVNYSPGFANIPRPTVYEELDSTSPIGRLTNVTKSQKSSFNNEVRETTNHYTMDHASSLKYSSGIASSQGIMNDLREDVSAHASVVRSAEVPTYETLRSNIVQNYSNIKPTYSSSMQQVIYRQ